MRDSAVMISSTMPSTKYSCSGSPLMFWNGRTAIDGLSATRPAAAGGSRRISMTSPTKRMPLRVKVRISRCVAPSSPSARRAALIRVVSADSETIRPPHIACKQIVLADHAVAVLHEEGQQIEDLGFDIERARAAAQFAPLEVEPVVAKRKSHLRPHETLPVHVLSKSQGHSKEKKAGRKAFCPLAKQHASAARGPPRRSRRAIGEKEKKIMRKKTWYCEAQGISASV